MPEEIPGRSGQGVMSRSYADHNEVRAVVAAMEAYR